MIDSSFNKIYLKCSSSYIAADGITNFNISSSISYENTHMLGGVQGPLMVNAPYDISIDIQKGYMEKEIIKSFTGTSPMECIVVYNGSNFFSVRNAYLTNYTAAFSVGDLPKINSKFTAFSQFVKKESSLSFPVVDCETFVTRLGSICLSGLNSDANTNFILKNNKNIYGFEYSLNIKRQPYYNIGSNSVVEVCPILPIEISFSMNSKVKNEADLMAERSIISMYPSSLNFSALITCLSPQNSVVIRDDFLVRNAKITSIEQSIGPNNIMDVKTNFVGYYGI
jgi:hypothetical protein